MSDRDTKLREYGLKYGQMQGKFLDAIETVPTKFKNVNERGKLLEKASQKRNSKTPNLYRLLKKNSDSMIKFGPEAFPSLSYNEKKQEFPNAPKITEVMKDIDPSIGALGNFGHGEGKKDCIVSLDGGQTETDYMKTKSSSDNLSNIDLPGISEEGLLRCDGPKCRECNDCEPHRLSMRKAINGIYAPNKEDDDLRILHLKSLASIFNNWAHHHDSRGGNSEMNHENIMSCNDDKYAECNSDHQCMSAHLRNMADRITDAIKSDYEKSNGKVGASEHRDAIYGNNKTEF